jgi:hypothetical protein
MKTLGYVLGGLAVAGLVAITPIVHFSTMDTVTFTVDHRERVISRDNEGKTSARYMIWAEYANGNTEVFENTDSLLSLKFNSADLYGRMRDGYLCHATVNGYRIPFMSMNRNILDAQCKEKD